MNERFYPERRPSQLRKRKRKCQRTFVVHVQADRATKIANQNVLSHASKITFLLILFARTWPKPKYRQSTRDLSHHTVFPPTLHPTVIAFTGHCYTRPIVQAVYDSRSPLIKYRKPSQKNSSMHAPLRFVSDPRNIYLRVLRLATTRFPCRAENWRLRRCSLQFRCDFQERRNNVNPIRGILVSRFNFSTPQSVSVSDRKKPIDAMIQNQKAISTETTNVQ